MRLDDKHVRADCLPRRIVGSGLALALLSILGLSGCGKTAQQYLAEARATPSLKEQEGLLSRALRKDPGYNDARFRRAWVYALQKEDEKALADYDVLRNNAKSPQDIATIFYWRGRALEVNDRFAEAANSYTKALNSDRWLLNPYLARAGAYFKMGKYTHSMGDYLAMLERDIDRQGTAVAERRSGWRLQCAVAAFCAGEWEKAANDFQIVYSETRSPARRARAMLNLYFVACRLGDKQTADEVFNSYASETLSRRRPAGGRTRWIFAAVWYAAGLIDEQQLLQASARQTASAHYYIGARHLANGADGEARQAFEKCVRRRDPTSLEYHMAKVELQRLLVGGKTAGDYVTMARNADKQGKKIELYTQALRVNPDHSDARLNRAMLYSLTGRHDRAIDDYTKLLKLYTRPSNRAAALRYRAWTYAQKGDHLTAIKDYEAAVEADPDLWQAREGLAASLCYLRRYKRAADVYTGLTKRIAGRGVQTFWQLERAFALCCAGEWETAARDFRAVLKKTGDAPIVRTNLYVAECKLGKDTAATEELNAYANELEVAGWQHFVARYAARVLDAEIFIKGSEHSERKTQLLRTSRAYYYIGARNLIEGDKVEAREAFGKCVRLGRKAERESWEYRMALNELARKSNWR